MGNVLRINHRWILFHIKSCIQIQISFIHFFCKCTREVVGQIIEDVGALHKFVCMDPAMFQKF